ncbi:unnamed protein product [Calypogeia fissa]
MGCERGVREAGNLGFGGVRASMERRWLRNAKTTVMRQKKWQEARLQKELDEQRQKAEILERRKRERARLAAYIHSAVQPPVKCATAVKRQRNDSKRVTWNTCLLRDQELILKLRENAKVVENAKIVARDHLSERGPSNVDPAVQGHDTSRTECRDSGLSVQFSVKPCRFGVQNLCLKGNPAESVQRLEVPTTCAEPVTQNRLSERDSHCTYQMLQLPARSEVAVNTSATWAPTRNNVPCEANFAEDHRSPSIPEISKWRSFTSDVVCDERNGSQSHRSVLPNSEDAGLQVATEVARCCAGLVETIAEFASLEIASSGNGESVKRRSSFDLKEEILRSRLVNEAATTRLIAQVTAIESRLDDCNMNWKSLCLRDDEVEGFPPTEPNTDFQRDSADVYPVHLNSVTSTICQFSLDKKTGQKNSSRVSGIGIKTVEQDFSNLEGQQSAQHLHQTRLFLSSPHPEQMKYLPERSSPCHESGGGPETSVSSGSLRFVKNNNSNGETCSHRVDAKAEKETVPRPSKMAGNGCDIVAMKATGADSMSESHAAWKIDWNAATDRVPVSNWEDLQGMQSGYSSRMSNLANCNTDRARSSHQSRPPHRVYESTQQKLPCFHNCGCNQPSSVHMPGGEDLPSGIVEGPTCPSHFPAFETLGLPQISSDLESGFPHTYTCQDTNWAQSAGFGSPMPSGNDRNFENVGPNVKYSPGDKENHLESERRSLLEEERKIFASLERLDWKLAAINLRSMNASRESTVSQGQYSMKSAPAIMGSKHCTIMEHFSMSAKKAVPYSALPPRPLTPQGAPMPRIPTARQRCLVGLTNKAGRIPNVNRKK